MPKSKLNWITGNLILPVYSHVIRLIDIRPLHFVSLTSLINLAWFNYFSVSLVPSYVPFDLETIVVKLAVVLGYIYLHLVIVLMTFKSWSKGYSMFGFLSADEICAKTILSALQTKSLTLITCSCAPFACINRRTLHLAVDIRCGKLLADWTQRFRCTIPVLHSRLLTYMCLQTCYECGKILERCPLCQQKITTRIRLYWSEAYGMAHVGRDYRAKLFRTRALHQIVIGVLVFLHNKKA